jgi:SAM-dependent methyltransferase
MPAARYDEIADFYCANFDAISDPAATALLSVAGPVAGLRVLDVACGHGRISRELARRGAAVTGIDISAALLGRAAEIERAAPLGVSYARADVTQPDALRQARCEPASWDAAVCSFGLSDIDALSPAIATVSAALRPGGWFAFTILHPCFAGAADIAGSWPSRGRYYDEGRWTPDSARSGLRRQVGATHRTLSTYLNTLREHELWLDQVGEPEPEASWDPSHEADRQPVFLAARCRKAARP